MVDAGVMSAGASGLLNLIAVPGPNGTIVLQQVPAVSATAPRRPFPLLRAFRPILHIALCI